MRGTIFSGFCFKLQKSVPFFRRSSSVEAVMGRKKKKGKLSEKRLRDEIKNVLSISAKE